MTMLLPNQQHEIQSRRAWSWGRVFLFGIMVVMGGLLVRVAQLKVIPNPKLDAAVGSTTSTRPEIGKRGAIFDRRARTIATTCVGYRLFVDPKEVADLGTIAVDIAAQIGGDPAEIDKKIFERADKRYVVVNPLLEDWQVEAINKANLRGVGLEERLVRLYPQGSLAAGIVGLVGYDHIGLGGFEHQFDKPLAPQNGLLTFLRDGRRRPLWIESDDFHPDHDGKDVQLSIDLMIQDIAEKRLREAVKENNAGGGRVVVIDTRTGEILAMCDVLSSRKGWSEATTDPGRKIHPGLGRNRCVTDPYEPGSTFKPFVWAVATELGKARLDEKLAIPEGGPLVLEGGRVIRDAHYYGPQTWRTVLVKSINAGMSIVAQRMTFKQMQDVLTRFGFGVRTNAGLPGESPGMITSAKKWSKYTQVSVSFGQEVAVTPLQMAHAFSAFARDGSMVKLRITVPGDDPLAASGPVISPATARLTREIMSEVMTEGTGRKAQSTKYRLFGKSGTAQLPKPKGRGYYEDRYVSSFIAGAPFNAPRIVVLCVIDDPDKSKAHLGGAVAGPIVRDIVDQTLEYLGVPAELPQTDQPAADSKLVATVH